MKQFRSRRFILLIIIVLVFPFAVQANLDSDSDRSRKEEERLQLKQEMITNILDGTTIRQELKTAGVNIISYDVEIIHPQSPSDRYSWILTAMVSRESEVSFSRWLIEPTGKKLNHRLLPQAMPVKQVSKTSTDRMVRKAIIERLHQNALSLREEVLDTVNNNMSQQIDMLLKETRIKKELAEAGLIAIAYSLDSVKTAKPSTEYYILTAFVNGSEPETTPFSSRRWLIEVKKNSRGNQTSYFALPSDPLMGEAFRTRASVSCIMAHSAP